jgi:SET domain-containing protein
MEIDNTNYYHNSKFNLYIDKSNIPNSGLGIFTKSFIEKDTLIDEYCGKKINWLSSGDYYYSIDDYNGIDAIEFPRCYMAMLNDASFKPVSKRGLKKFIPHNYTNNCYFNTDKILNRVYIYSLVNIEINKELFISYGPDYWNN